MAPLTTLDIYRPKWFQGTCGLLRHVFLSAATRQNDDKDNGHTTTGVSMASGPRRGAALCWCV